MREFSLIDQLAMYAATAGCLLVVFIVLGALVLLTRLLIRSARHHRASKL